MKLRLLLLFILLTVILGWSPSVARMQDAPPDVCQQSENILANCNFNNGKDHWQTFTEDGSADFDVLQGGGGCHAPLCPAAYIVTPNYFVGGIYQQMPAVKGNTYYANIVWLVFDSFVNDKSVYDRVGGIGRKMGIDPFGGNDPRSPNIVWGPENTRNDCKICASQEVTATAQADTITVFLRIDDRWRQRAAEQGYSIPPSKDQFWLDDIGMKQVAGSAAPPPTDTPVPPTDTPVPEPPTNTPAPATEELQAEVVAQATEELKTEAAATAEPAQLTDAPAETAEAEPATVEAVSPIATPTPESFIAPPPTLTPSVTPSPTATFEPRVRAQPITPSTRRPAPEPVAAGLAPVELLGVAGTTACIGGAALLLLGAALVGLVWLYPLGWGKVDADDPDDAEEKEIIIEIEDDK